ncbi:hypothetical protein LEMLEM_LOCUS24499, partial [Lemmus lemmus]
MIVNKRYPKSAALPQRLREAFGRGDSSSASPLASCGKKCIKFVPVLLKPNHEICPEMFTSATCLCCWYTMESWE